MVKFDPKLALTSLNREVDEALKDPGCTNLTRRKLYTKVELMVMDYEDSLQTDAALKEFRADDEFQAALKEVHNKLHMVPIARAFRVWYWIDIIYRFIGVNCAIFTITILCAMPILILQPFENLLGVDPFKRLSVRVRQVMCNFILLCSGIVVDFGEIDPSFFDAQCALLCFSHSSNVDGFIVCSGCPIRHYAFGKKELFYVPFFSWISFAAGGVPVDRENKDRAIAALKRASEAAVESKACIAIAPEGTRTKSGHLLDFKKGPFHIQQELGSPIIPLVVYGAWDLYPVGSWVNQCGRVAARFLEPISATTATAGTDRDKDGEAAKVRSPEEMRRLTRRQMLEALTETPAGTGDDLTVGEWAACYLTNAVNMAFVAGIAKLYAVDLFARYLGMTTWETVGYTAMLMLGFTAALFVYSVYVLNWISAVFGGGKGQNKSKQA